MQCAYELTNTTYCKCHETFKKRKQCNQRVKYLFQKYILTIAAKLKNTTQFTIDDKWSCVFKLCSNMVTESHLSTETKYFNKLMAIA